jgi:hypothetical protein
MSMVYSGDSIQDTDGGVLRPISSVMRNRLINSAMTINQRGWSGTVSSGNAQYTLDRWVAVYGTGGWFSVSQNAGSVTPPTGFVNYLGITSTGTNTADIDTISQFIEGFNTADLMWGTANARTVTLSFWVRSSLTGTFGGALSNNARNRSYPFSYTISAANTWEYKTVTIAGDTTGTWLTNNSIGIRLDISIGCNATFSGTAGAWAGSDFRSATGATSVVGTNGATFYITGVQLEVGTQATSFEYRQYTTELQLAQRYYQTIGGDTAQQFAGTGMSFGTNSSNIYIPLLVKMRTTPTIGFSSVSDWGVTYGAGAQAAGIGIVTDQSSTVSANISITVSGSPLTVGAASKLIAQSTTAARLNFSSEL